MKLFINKFLINQFSLKMIIEFLKFYFKVYIFFLNPFHFVLKKWIFDKKVLIEFLIAFFELVDEINVIYV